MAAAYTRQLGGRQNGLNSQAFTAFSAGSEENRQLPRHPPDQERHHGDTAMKNDFSETLESIARALTEQNEAWSAARAVFEKLDGSSPVSVPAELFDEIEQASGPRTRGAQILSAFRA